MREVGGVRENQGELLFGCLERRERYFFRGDPGVKKKRGLNFLGLQAWRYFGKERRERKQDLQRGAYSVTGSRPAGE